MKKWNFKQLSKLWIGVFLIISSCEKNDPVPEVDQEVITKVSLSFTEISETGELIPGTTFEAVASDAEGISLGNTLEIDVINALESGKKYRLDISLFNGITGKDITGEIAEDDTAHQFYFFGSALVGPAAFLSYVYGDADGNGNPVGLKGDVTVAESNAANTGTLRVILRHGSNKDFEGAENPHFENFEQAGGESDLDITFQVTL